MQFINSIHLIPFRIYFEQELIEGWPRKKTAVLLNHGTFNFHPTKVTLSDTELGIVERLDHNPG